MANLNRLLVLSSRTTLRQANSGSTSVSFVPRVQPSKFTVQTGLPPARLLTTTSTKSGPSASPPGSGLVKTKEAVKRDATIAKFRKREEQERKYGATLPQAVLVVGAGSVVAILVAGAWLWQSGVFNRRSRRSSTLGDEKGYIVNEDHKCNNACAGCEKPITGSVVAAGGKLWHPQHLVCNQCKTALQSGKAYLRNGKLYCEKDHRKMFCSNCSVCNNSLSLKWSTTTDSRGDVFCSHHSAEFKPCTTCQQLVTPQVGSGGVTHTDGRAVCGGCHSTAVISDEDASILLEEVRADLEAITGISMGKEAIPIHLVNLDGFGGHDGLHVQGITRKQVTTSTMRDRIIGRGIQDVLVLNGLPRVQAGQVIAHELMHSHLFLRAFPEMSRVAEEGLCELAAYLWVTAKYAQNDGDRETGLVLRKLENNPNVLYGQGLHLALRSYMASDATFSDFLQCIHKTGKLPMGPVLSSTPVPPPPPPSTSQPQAAPVVAPPAPAPTPEPTPAPVATPAQAPPATPTPA